MVIGALPAAKLGMLFLRQFTKKIADGITNTAVKHPFILDKMCIPSAQLYNQMQVRFRLKSLKLSKKEKIPPLNKKAASKLGAQILSEGILFIIGAALLTFELIRQSKNEAEKQRQMKEKEQELLDRISTLEEEIDNLTGKGKKDQPMCRSRIN